MNTTVFDVWLEVLVEVYVARAMLFGDTDRSTQQAYRAWKTLERGKT